MKNAINVRVFRCPKERLLHRQFRHFLKFLGQRGTKQKSLAIGRQRSKYRRQLVAEIIVKVVKKTIGFIKNLS